MESRSNAIAAGLFVIVMTIALILAALWLARDTLDRVRYVVASQIAITGLHAKAAVRLRGVDVGRVDEIAFDPGDPRTILIGISVDRRAPVTAGTYGQLGFQGVTGLSYIALDDDGADPRPLAADHEPPSRIPLRASLFDSLGDSSRDLMRDASAVARRLAQLVSDPNVARAGSVLHNLDEASRQVAQLAARLQPAAQSLPGLEVQAHGLIAHLDQLVVDAHTMTADLDRRLAAIDQVGKGAQDVGAAGRAIQAALAGDTLPRFAAAADELSSTARQLAKVLEQIEHRPQSLIFGRHEAAPGPGEPGFAPPAGR